MEEQNTPTTSEDPEDVEAHTATERPPAEDREAAHDADVEAHTLVERPPVERNRPPVDRPPVE